MALPISSTLHRYRPSKSFTNTAPGATLTSLDFSSTGSHLIATSTDETLQLYDTQTGRHSKTLFSKKYGCHLARFTHNPSNVVYASTKENDTLRYLSLHDNSFIRYFRGHTGLVNSLEISPVDDQLISCAADNSIRLWDLRSPNNHGLLHLPSPCVATFDPSGIIFAVASHQSSTVLLYDLRNYDKSSFNQFHVTDDAYLSSFSYPPRMPPWTTLEFSNDGKHMLVGTQGAHYLLDSFQEQPNNRFLARLVRPRGPTSQTGSADVCWSPDGRYIIGGQGEGKGCAVWDIHRGCDEKKTAKPVFELEAKNIANSVVRFCPTMNVLATAGKEVVFWLPEQHAPDPPASPQR